MSDINEVIFDLTSLRDGPWDLTQVDRSALTEAIALLERSAGVWVPVGASGCQWGRDGQRLLCIRT